MSSHESTKGLVDTHVEIFAHGCSRFSGLAVSCPRLLVGLWTSINSNQAAHELGYLLGDSGLHKKDFNIVRSGSREFHQCSPVAFAIGLGIIQLPQDTKSVQWTSCSNGHPPKALPRAT